MVFRNYSPPERVAYDRVKADAQCGFYSSGPVQRAVRLPRPPARHRAGLAGARSAPGGRVADALRRRPVRRWTLGRGSVATAQTPQGGSVSLTVGCDASRAGSIDDLPA